MATSNAYNPMTDPDYLQEILTQRVSIPLGGSWSLEHDEDRLLIFIMLTSGQQICVNIGGDINIATGVFLGGGGSFLAFNAKDDGDIVRQRFTLTEVGLVASLVHLWIVRRIKK